METVLSDTVIPISSDGRYRYRSVETGHKHQKRRPTLLVLTFTFYVQCCTFLMYALNRPNTMPVKKSEPNTVIRSKTELSVPRAKADPSPQMRRKAPSGVNHSPMAPPTMHNPRSTHSVPKAPPVGHNHLEVTTPTTNGAGSNSSLSRQSSM